MSEGIQRSELAANAIARFVGERKLHGSAFVAGGVGESREMRHARN